MTPLLQEAVALAFVLLVAGTALVRRWRQRRAGCGCNGCAFSGPTCSSCDDRPPAPRPATPRGLPILSG